MSQVPQAPAQQDLLLHTKLRRPRAVGQLMRRPRLLELLNQGLTLPLTIVSAPAGYGKTTLVATWLGETGVPWAWYSVDEQDNSLAMFAAYLAAAVASAYPGAGAALQATTQSPILPPPARLADLFVAELDTLPGDLLLILDDYHTIDDLQVHQFMSSLIQSAPEGVHLVMLVRSDPPLKLARLRARQQVCEVRAAQLRFTEDETRDLLHRILGDLATEETVALFAARTEGWAAGIHLAATSMRDSEDAASFAASFARSSSQAIVDFLMSEVLESLAPRERDLLLRTSILARFCAPLCDALMPHKDGAYDGRAFLEHLRSINPFLVTLDEEGAWYRFHQLFADILRHHLRRALDEPAIAQLHEAASRWFEGKGLLDEAITHALSAGDPLRAARLVETHTDTLLGSENWRALERWLSLLPEAQTRRPALLAARGWVEQFRYRVPSILALAEAADASLGEHATLYTPGETAAIRATVLTLRALAHTYMGRWPAALPLIEQALANLGKERAYVRGIAELVYIRTTARLGRQHAAIAQAEAWLREQGSRPDARTLRLLLVLCGTYYDLLALDDLHATATSYRHVAVQARQQVSVGWATWVLGFACYQRNDLPHAQVHCAEVIRYPHEAHTRTVIDSWTGLCLCLRAQGQYAEAMRAAAQLRSFLLEGGLLELAPMADVLTLYLQLLEGELPRVSDSFSQNLPGQLGQDFWLAPVLVWALGGIRSGGREQHAVVAAKLAEYRALLAADYVPRRLLELELVEALLHDACGRQKVALDCVRRAVAIAEPHGVVRSFLDLGTDLLPYVHQLADLGVAPEFLKRLIAAFAQGATTVAPAEGALTVFGMVAGTGTGTGANAVSSVQAENGSAILGPDALSNRELDVLLLLDRRLSNKEIADLLFISPRTVKRHTISIYSKLHVDNRRAAVARAKALGLMPVV
jgi:LuxR family maltose regulon positive regulatory protein